MEGTEKQIKWATEICEKAIANIREKMNEPGLKRHVERGTKQAIDKVAKMNLAIENIGKMKLASTAIANKDLSTQGWVDFFGKENHVEAELSALSHG